MDDHRHAPDAEPPADPFDEPVVTYEAAPADGLGANGPPPPPFVRERKRRRRIALAISAALLVVGIPVGLAIVSALQELDSPTAAPGTGSDEGEDEVAGPEDGADPDDGAADADPGGGADERRSDDAAETDAGGADDVDGESDGESDGGADGGSGDDRSPTLARPDVDALDGLDAIYAELLIAIDASERTMIAFQEEVGDAFANAGSPGEGVVAVGLVAGTRRLQLLEHRERLVDGLDDDGAEQVRSRYVEHLDSWADYLGAIEEDPALLIEGRNTAFTVVINATADAFARAVESELPADIAVEVERFAEGILDRGFRGFTDAQV